MTAETKAVRALDRGGVVAVATETVYGLVCRLDRPEAIDRLFGVKERSREAPFQVLFASVDAAASYAELGDAGRAIAGDLMPGPVTLVCRALRRLPDLGGAPGTIGVRVSDHPAVARLLHTCGPLVATSANRSGSPTPETIEGVRRVFGGEVDAYLDMPPAPAGRSSTVVELTGPEPVILREGAVSRERLAHSLRSVR